MDSSLDDIAEEAAGQHMLLQTKIYNLPGQIAERSGKMKRQVSPTSDKESPTTHCSPEFSDSAVRIRMQVAWIAIPLQPWTHCS